MQNAKVTVTFQIDNVDGKTLDEIYGLVDEQLRKSGLDEAFSPLWDCTRVFDDKGNEVDSDYC